MVRWIKSPDGLPFPRRRPCRTGYHVKFEGRQPASPAREAGNGRIGAALAGEQVLEVGMARVVLVVDDEPSVLDVTTLMLEDLGCDVVSAGSGGEALALLSENREIEVLITDLNMPGMNGYELADKAADLRPDLLILLLSGREGDGHGHPILCKPFLEEDLARTMRQTTGLC